MAQNVRLATPEGTFEDARAHEREIALLDREALIPRPALTDKLQTRGFIAGMVGLVLLIVGALTDIHQFWHSYLVGFVYVALFPLGALGILMLQYVSGGAWGIMTRRILEAASRTIPLIALFFLPIIFGMHNIYEWTHKEVVQHSAILREKSGYLNENFFVARQSIYFAIWVFLAYRISGLSRRQDRVEDETLTRSMARLSGPGILLFVLTMTFASVDWIMSLNPEWMSTMFGLMVIIGSAVSALALVIVIAAYFAGRDPMSAFFVPSHFHDLGKLLFAFVMVWAYFSFSQFLITWSGNLPEEIVWYLARIRGGWQIVAYVLVLSHFSLPFVLLLSKGIKKNRKTLVVVASWLVFMRFIDVFWLISPEFSRGHFHMSWMDLAAPLAFGGLWFAYFIWNFKGEALLPVREPELHEALNPTGH